MITAYYDKSAKVWVAYCHDEFGQIGAASYGPTKDLAIYSLGYEVGRNPQAFTRPMWMFMESYDKENA